MKREHPDNSTMNGAASGSSSGLKSECSSMSSGKMKIWEDELESSNGMDELLAAMGYKVRSSDMADVAQKLEKLEMALATSQEHNISHLASDTVHYDPTDIHAWVQSMLTELHDPQNDIDPLLGNPQIQEPIGNFPNSPPQIPNLSTVFHDDSEYDLRAIPGKAAFPQLKTTSDDKENANKRLKTDTREAREAREQARPVVLVDSQENGVRIVHALMACAEAVQQNNLKLAEALVEHVGRLSVSQAGAMRKVATCFAQALAHRIYGISQPTIDNAFSDLLYMHFYESCPYLKFAHFTANQAILEAFATAHEVHVIDFGLRQGMQWPALMQALALRPGGPPRFRLTGIGPPQADNSDPLQQVGWKLAQLAKTIGVEFEFRGYVCSSLVDLDPGLIEIRPGESVAVNSVFELHGLLARGNAVERVLSAVKAVNPKIVTVVEQEASHNEPGFVDRFTEALHYYSTMFDSIEGSAASSDDVVMTEVYLGRQICDVVACEGAERVERHEPLSSWRGRFGSAGFEPVHLGSNAFKQASMLLAVFAGGDGYRVEENNGCLLLGWHTRPLIATSAWRIAAAATGEIALQ